MNVCLLNDSFPPIIDGVANVVMNYARILQEQGLADVTVATPAYPGVDYSGYPFQVVPYQSFNTARFANGYRAGNPFDFSELEELIASKPDIIHSHCPMASTIMARLIRARTGAPLVITYHTKFDIDIARALKNKALRDKAIKAMVNNMEACDEMWVVSEGAGENLKSLGYTGDYVVMSNGVDFAKGRVDADTVAEVTKNYDLPEGVPVFLFVGRMLTYKGLPLILDALALLEKQDFDYRMVFIGGGADAGAMKERAEELGLKHCFFTGPISDRQVLRAWNTRADLFLFPSTYDTNGIVVREAAACGLASVLIQGSCAAEGISHGRNGYLIEENADSMASLLMDVGSRLDELDKVGLCAMDEIYISWDESVKAAYDRYQVILANREKRTQQRETQMREDRQELPDLDDFGEEARTHLESAWDKVRVPVSKIEDILDGMRFDADTMLGNAMHVLDERMEEMRQRGERMVKWRTNAKDSLLDSLNGITNRRKKEEDESI